jgi:hypothetical protein
MDPAKAFAPRLVPGAWYVDARDLGHQAMARHPFYGEFFHKFELGSYMACLVERQPHYEVYFSMQRSLAQGNFSGDDAQRLDWVVPHMRSAIAIRDRTLALSTMATLSTRLIERLAFAVAIYSPDRRLLLANTAGERWARRLDPLGKTTEWQLSRSFMEMLQAACDPAKPQAARRPGPSVRMAARPKCWCCPCQPATPLPRHGRASRRWSSCMRRARRRCCSTRSCATCTA